MPNASDTREAWAIVRGLVQVSEDHGIDWHPRYEILPTSASRLILRARRLIAKVSAHKRRSTK